MASKKSSKYIQTEFGLYPANYFFSSGVKSNQADNKLSSSVIKSEILKIIKDVLTFVILFLDVIV